MADNVTLNTGSGGDVVATEDVAGVEYQKVKLVDGTAASTTAIPLSGDLTNGLDVDVTRVGGTVTVDGSGVTQPVSAASLPLPSGAATAANQLADGHNVTVDNASGASAVNIQDGGNSITVDGTVTANAGTGTMTVDGSGVTQPISASSLPLPSGAATSANQLAAGHEVSIGAATTAAGDLAKAVDAAAGGSDVGIATLAIRDDALTTLTPIDGDYVPLRVGSTGALHVTGGGGGTEYTEDVATPNPIVGTATMMERDDALSTLTPAEGDWAAQRCDSQGALWVNVVNADGTSNVDTAAGGTDSGAVTLAVRDDTLTTLTPIDGDYTPLRVNSTGALHVTGAGGGTQYSIDDAAPTVVTMAGTIRDDTLSTLTEADGDASTLRVNSTGALHVTGGGGGTEYVVNAAAPTDPTGTASLMERDDALSALTEIEGDWTNQRANANGAMWVTLDGTATVDGSAVTQPISAASLPLPSGAATSAGQLADGHNVTIDNASGGSAVNIQDGGNSITIDGTVTANLSATDNAVLDQIEINTSYGDNTGGGTETGALRVTLANNSTGVLSVDDNGGSLTIDNADITTIAGAVSGTEMQVDLVGSIPAGTNNIGDVDVLTLPALAAGTNNIGDVDVATIAAGTTLIGDVGLSGARTSGGTTLYKNLDVDESEDQVKGSAGQVYWIHAINTTAALIYLKFYNVAAASVTVGTTVPDLTFPVPAATTGAGFTLSIPNGIEFDTAITISATTGVADADSGAPGANAIICNLGYA